MVYIILTVTKMTEAVIPYITPDCHSLFILEPESEFSKRL